jgi:LysR family transcriptional regulator, nitrogen assimilation regulatory protein
LIEAPGRRRAPDQAELAELGVGPFVLSCSPNGMRTIVDGAARRLNIKMQITAEIDSLDALKEIVESGPERSILPLGAVHREVKAGRLRSRLFTDPQMQALLVLATPLNKSVSKLAAAVLRLVEEEISRCVHDGILSGVAGSKLRQTIVGKTQTAPMI